MAGKAHSRGAGRRMVLRLVFFSPQENFPRADRQTRETRCGEGSPQCFISHLIYRPAGLRDGHASSGYNGPTLVTAQQDGRRTRPLSHRSSILVFLALWMTGACGPIIPFIEKSVAEDVVSLWMQLQGRRTQAFVTGCSNS